LEGEWRAWWVFEEIPQTEHKIGKEASRKMGLGREHRNGHYQGTNFKGTATADETQVYKRSAVILQEKQGTRKHASNRKEIYKQASGKQQLKPLTKV
jgi:hypothetical protein